MRQARLLLPLVLAAALVTGCGGDDSTADAGADPATLMPADATFYLEGVVRPEGDVKSDAEALAGKVLRTDDPSARIQELIDGELAEEGASYAEDIEPWLGQRFGMATTDITVDEPAFVGALGVSDADAAREFVEQQAGDRERSYEGTDYFIDGDTVVGVIGDEFIGIADDEAGFRSLVDAAGGEGLAGVESFSAAIDELPDERLGTLWLDTRRVVEAAQAGGAQPEAQALLQSLGALEPITAVLLASSDSATIESRVAVPEGGAGDALGTLGGGEPPALLRTVPADAVVAFGVAELGEAVRTGIESVAGGIGSALLGGQLQSQIGLDLERDLLSWIGDVAVYASGESVAELGGAVIIGATDADAAGDALPRIVGAARQALGAPLQPAELDGADQAFVAPLPGAPGPLVLARRGDRVVLAVGEETAATALDPDETIEDSGLYERARTALDGLEPSLLVDAQPVVALIGQVAGGDPDFAQAQPYLELLDLLAAGTERDGDVVRQRVTAKVE